LQGEFCNLQGGKKSDTKEEKPQVTEWGDLLWW
jgi:hypothetical protein